MNLYGAGRQQKRKWWYTKGFTLMEVLVGMALMGICAAILISLLADHLRITQKLIERGNKILYAINKTEEACLGLLGDNFEKAEGKKIWRDTVGKGLPWKVIEQVSEEDKETFLYDVTIADVFLQGVRIQIRTRSSTTEQ